MSKLCKFCNAEMADDALQCPECEKFIPGYENAKRKKTEKEHSKKKLIITLSCIAVVIILIVVIINAVINTVTKNSQEADSDYSKIFDRYIESILNTDYDEYLALYPDFYAKEIDEMYSYVCEDSADYIEMLKESMEKQFGLINEVTYTINSEGVASEEAIESYKDEWINVYGCDENADVSQVYIIDVDFSISGRNISDSINQNVMLSKINGKWYLMNFIYLFDTESTDTATVTE